MTHTEKPTSTEYFQSALARGKFLLQQCRDCGQLLSAPVNECPCCGDDSFKWIEASGWGLVLSAQGQEIPHKEYRLYNIALDEGVQVTAPVIEPGAKEVKSGMKVLAHVALEEGVPALLFTGQEDVDEW